MITNPDAQEPLPIVPVDDRRCFAFAVCGGAAHVRELHDALASLRHHTRARLLVVTDSGRNEIPIAWPDVIDVKTPAHLDHHQASIYLKTRIHRLVPAGNRCCYLDSDVFATGADADEVFSSVATPVAFAADLVRLHEFSPYAIRCGCLETNAAERAALEAALADAYRQCSGTCGSPQPGWSRPEYEANASRPFIRLAAYVRHLLTPVSRSQYGDPDDILWRDFWYENHENTMRKPKRIIRAVETSTAWRRDRRRQSWISPAGNDVYHLGCDHLTAAIRKTFGVSVTTPRWQHWNGGVFLFDDRGHAFLDAWHEKTMRIFAIPEWRTRDQGTLVATAWEFGLQDQQLLPRRFNCILAPHAGGTMVGRGRDAVTTDAFLTTIRPALAHVLGYAEDPTWDVGRWVQDRARGSVS